MKTLGWLVAAAVMAIGAWMEYGGGGPVRGGAFTHATPVAFDANHAPVPVRVEVEGTSLALIVEGASLERVRWPVTVDLIRPGR